MFTCRMELDKLHVLVRKSRAGHHRSAVASAGVRAGAGEVGASIASRRQDRVLRSEAVDATVFHAHSCNAWWE